jgi:hypothetical protein
VDGGDVLPEIAQMAGKFNIVRRQQSASHRCAAAKRSRFLNCHLKGFVKLYLLPSTIRDISVLPPERAQLEARQDRLGLSGAPRQKEDRGAVCVQGVVGQDQERGEDLRLVGAGLARLQRRLVTVHPVVQDIGCALQKLERGADYRGVGRASSACGFVRGEWKKRYWLETFAPEYSPLGHELIAD